MSQIKNSSAILSYLFENLYTFAAKPLFTLNNGFCFYHPALALSIWKDSLKI